MGHSAMGNNADSHTQHTWAAAVTLEGQGCRGPYQIMVFIRSTAFRSSHKLCQFKSSVMLLQVFVGSFRGGKRGGSRTAHLKATAAEAEVTTEEEEEADSPITTWRSAKAQRSTCHHPAKQLAGKVRNSCQTAAQAEPKLAEVGDKEKQVQEEEDEPISEDDEGEQAAEEEEKIEDEATEDEEGKAGGLRVEESGELVFEAEVVDALASLPSSQHQG